MHFQFTMNLYKKQVEEGRPRAFGIREQLGRGLLSEFHGHERCGNCACVPISVREAGPEDWEPTEEAHRVEVQRAQDPVLVRPVWGA